MTDVGYEGRFPEKTEKNLNTLQPYVREGTYGAKPAEISNIRDGAGKPCMLLEPAMRNCATNRIINGKSSCRASVESKQ